jgi:hypothetical protein
MWGRAGAALQKRVTDKEEFYKATGKRRGPKTSKYTREV